MTGADNPDSLYKPSLVFKKWERERKRRKAKKKPKKIPKGFMWDPVHHELIDVRCNNPKLKKLSRESIRVDTPAICISPFYPLQDTGPLQKGLDVLKTEEAKPFVPIKKRRKKKARIK